MDPAKKDKRSKCLITMCTEGITELEGRVGRNMQCFFN